MNEITNLWWSFLVFVIVFLMVTLVHKWDIEKLQKENNQLWYAIQQREPKRKGVKNDN